MTTGGKPNKKWTNREAVVAAAADIADQEGLEAVTLTRFSTVLDRHVTSLYTHVDNLPSLRRGIAVLGATELGEALWLAVLGRSGVDALGELARAYRAYALAHPGRYYAMTVTTDEGDEEFLRAGQRVTAAIRAVLSSFGLDAEQTIHAHRIFASAIRGFALVEHTRGFVPDPPSDRTFDDLIDLFATALASAAWPAGHQREESTARSGAISRAGNGAGNAPPET